MMIKIKPLSINSAYQGRRFKNGKHKVYEEELMWLLPKMKVPKENIEMEITFGVSSKLSDLDNLVKVFLDCCQKKYLFNDREIIKLVLKKELVKKGREYIKFYFI